MNVSDLLNFTSDGGSMKQQKKKNDKGNGLLLLQAMQNQLIQLDLTERRNSFDNNPFDRVVKQVETFKTDPFEFVAAQTQNYSLALDPSTVKTANLIDLSHNEFNKENDHHNNTEKKRIEHESSSSSTSSKKNSPSTSGRDNIVGFDNTNKNASSRRDSLLKYSLANASKSTMQTNSIANNFLSEKWMEQMIENENDSFNDIMKQECNLIDSDGSDFEYEFNIPMLQDIDKQTTQIKQRQEKLAVENFELKVEEKNRTYCQSNKNCSINEKAIAKLNEIKNAHAHKMEGNMIETVNKLKEMMTQIDDETKSEASQLLEQLCVALNKSSEKKAITKPPPPNMIRQDTFDIDQDDEEVEQSDSSVNTSDNNSHVQSVIEQLSKALGNVNVLQASSPTRSSVNPIVVVVVNPESGYTGMSDTITLKTNKIMTSECTPPSKAPRRSQSFSAKSNFNKIAAADQPPQKAPELHATPQRAVQPKRRSFSFNTPNIKPTVRPSILPPPALNTVKARPSVIPEKQKKTSILDKIKPKIGFSSNTEKKTSTKQGPLKATVPLKTFVRQKSPDNRSIKSLPVRTTPVKPIASSTPLNRVLTPHKPTQSRISFYTPTRQPTRTTTTTTNVTNKSSGITRRRSLNDKDKPKPSSLTSIKAMPRPTTNIGSQVKSINSASSIGTLTQRKFPPQNTASIYTSTKSRPMTTQLKTIKK